MRILIRYIISTIFQKPFRFALILLTISLSGAAIFASVSISDTMIETTMNKWRYEYGYSDIVITSSLSSPSRYFDQFKADKYDDYFTYKVGKLTSYARIDDNPVMLHGYTLETLLQMLNMPFLQELNPFPFAGNKIIISQKYANEYGIGLDDTLTVSLNGKKNQYIVCAIASANGPFAYENDSYSVIVPYEKVQAALGQLGKADTIYIGLKNLATKSHMILRLSDLYKGYQVSETYSVSHIRLQSNRSAVPFVFMSVLLCLMAVYVIYVIFQNVAIERMPLMGIFRTIGADRQGTDAVMMMEAASYGIAGGVLSLGLGVLILYAIARHLFQSDLSGDIGLSVSLWHVGLTLLASIGISIVGGFLALSKYKGTSIIGLVKQNVENNARSGVVLPFIAFALFAMSLTALLLIQSLDGLVVYVALVVVMMVSILMASPLLYNQFTYLTKKLMDKTRGIIKITSFSIQNQRGFLIAAAILSVIAATNIVIGAITYSNDKGCRKYYERFHYDIEITTNDLTRGKMNAIEQLPGVLGVCANYYSAATEVAGQSISIYRIHGIDTQKASDFMDYQVSSTYKRPFDELDNGKTILITNTLGRIYNVKENDLITLKIHSYSGLYKEIQYKVVGFFDDEYTKLGRYALISHESFSEDFRPGQYSSLYVMTYDMDAALESIGNIYRDSQAQITTVQTMKDGFIEESGLIISAMQWISYISAVTGVLGMLFIMILSFQSRGTELSIYGAMGLAKNDVGKVLFTEMLLVGVAGMITGVIMGALISYIALPKLIYSLQIAMSIYFSMSTILNSCFIGLGICVTSGIIGVISFRRTTLMGGLRSE